MNFLEFHTWACFCFPLVSIIVFHFPSLYFCYVMAFIFQASFCTVQSSSSTSSLGLCGALERGLRHWGGGGQHGAAGDTAGGADVWGGQVYWRCSWTRKMGWSRDGGWSQGWQQRVVAGEHPSSLYCMNLHQFCLLYSFPTLGFSCYTSLIDLTISQAHA